MPEPAPGEVRVRVHACGCCRTDLHVVEGDLELPHLPVVPGHQVVGVVDALGDGCATARASATGSASPGCTTPAACASSAAGARRTSACAADFTGWTVDGGYADDVTVPEDVRGPASRRRSDDLEAAPLLCAGVIGYRALRRAEVQPGERVALLGFGASAHLALQVLQHWGCEVVVLTRGERHRELARELGASWVGDADGAAAGDRATAPSCSRPPASSCRSRSATVRPGGTVSLAGIHMSDDPVVPYDAPLARAEPALGRQHDARATRRSSWTSPPTPASAPSTRCSRSRRPTTRCSRSSADAVRGAAVLRDALTQPSLTRRSRSRMPGSHADLEAPRVAGRVLRAAAGARLRPVEDDDVVLAGAEAG